MKKYKLLRSFVNSSYGNPGGGADGVAVDLLKKHENVVSSALGRAD